MQLLNQNPENPYEVEFRHNAFGNTGGPMADGLVAFNLDSLPDTQGKTVKLKLVWHSYSGEKSTEFDYCTRKSSPVSSAIAAERKLLSPSSSMPCILLILTHLKGAASKHSF